MITVIFEVGATAGLLSYLLQKRADRVVGWIGDPYLFSAFISAMETNNPYLTGVISFEIEVTQDQAITALRQCLGWLLPGVDPAAVLKFMVIHREPSDFAPGGFRTAIHFTIALFHRGLPRAKSAKYSSPAFGKTIRPYVNTRDFKGLLALQTAINRLNGWHVPLEHPAGLRFSHHRHDPLAERYIAACQQYIHECKHFGINVSAPEDIAKALSRAVLHVDAEIEAGTGQTDVARGSATIITLKKAFSSHAYSLQLPGQRPIKLARLVHPYYAGERDDPEGARDHGRYAGEPEIQLAEIGRLTGLRRAYFEQEYGEHWFNPVAGGSGLRELLEAFHPGPQFRNQVTGVRGPAYDLVRAEPRIAPKPTPDTLEHGPEPELPGFSGRHRRNIPPRAKPQAPDRPGWDGLPSR